MFCMVKPSLLYTSCTYSTLTGHLLYRVTSDNKTRMTTFISSEAFEKKTER